MGKPRVQKMILLMKIKPSSALLGASPEHNNKVFDGVSLLQYYKDVFDDFCRAAYESCCTS